MVMDTGTEKSRGGGVIFLNFLKITQGGCERVRPTQDQNRVNVPGTEKSRGGVIFLKTNKITQGGCERVRPTPTKRINKLIHQPNFQVWLVLLSACPNC